MGRRRRDWSESRWHWDGSPPVVHEGGRRGCRWCKGPVRPPRRSFCSAGCVHEWRMRADVSYMRRQVRKRDRGVCAACGRDTLAWYREVRASVGLSAVSARRRYAAPNPPELRAALASLGVDPNRKTLWDAHHVIEHAAGGDTTLSNLATLCCPCHKAATSAFNSTRGAGA